MLEIPTASGQKAMSGQSKERKSAHTSADTAVINSDTSRTNIFLGKKD